MNRVPAEASRGLRWGCLMLAAAVTLVAVANDPADARSRRKRHQVKRHHAAATYNPPYAAIVVDAKSGKVLHQANADRVRHPASLTKIMTLFLLFERLESGELKLDSPLQISKTASLQAPTKLGLKPGETITVEDAIKALVTKSANDVAVAVAEALADSEEEFARRMTQKAHALGMPRTVYRNASGLPDDQQVTTAREQALLGMAIQERFPRYYRYFSIEHFVFRGRGMRNHNKLLGRVEGVDGIKTGYVRASGFNLVASVHRGRRQIVAVVLGGRSSGQRDARMRQLIETQIAKASTKDAVKQFAAVPLPKPEPGSDAAAILQLAAAESTLLPHVSPRPSDATAAIPAPRPGSVAPIKPIPVKTLTVKLVPPKRPPAAKSPPVPATVTASVAAAAPAAAPAQSAEPAAAVEAASSPPPGARGGILGTLPAMAAAAAAKDAALLEAKAEHAPPRRSKRGGWAIQVGAFEDEQEAKERLSSAQSTAPSLLEKADAYTERTKKGDKTYYRARFAGFDRDRAHAACRRLKRNDIACMPLKI